MHCRRLIILLLIVVSLFTIRTVIYAQPVPQLQLALIGEGAGPYYTPLGQTTQLKLEILNSGPHDVYLVRGETYLDPTLSGNWKLVHAEDTGNFHLANLQSAIWTFDLIMPSSIHAGNVTNGVPQVNLLIEIIYSTDQGLQLNAKHLFSLSVPGANVENVDYWFWSLPVGLAIVAIMVLVYRKKLKRVSS